MNDNYLTALDIARDLGVSRQRVHQIIKDFKLDFIDQWGRTLVTKKSYAAYKKLRTRRDLAQAAGRLSNKFIYDESVDTTCPACGAYAVIWRGFIACKNRHVTQEGNPPPDYGIRIKSKKDGK